MKLKNQRRVNLENLSKAILRFPFSTAAFALATLLVMYTIQAEDASSLMDEVTCLVMAGFASTLAQLLYERFFKNQEKYKFALYAGAVIFAFLYYLYLSGTDINDQRVMIRTGIVFFILHFASIWAPTIRQADLPFSKSFVVFFKAHFTTLLFSFVLLIGTFTVLGTFHALITEVNWKVYSHVAALIALSFTPIYFLSLIPIFSINEKNRENVDEESFKRAVSVPKFLEVLLSYIVIPLVVAFTFILLLYILGNITGDFWNDNLLEPMLVSYAVNGWITLFLIESVETRNARLFKKYFPKLLLVVVSLQTIASILRISTYGVTHGRYYVILFGLFSIVSSVIYSFFYPKRNVIPGILLTLSLISIIPPIDAVTVGIDSQKNRLVDTLESNGLLENDTINKEDSIPERDREMIADSVRYLDRMNELDALEFIPDNFSLYSDFESTFGFNLYTLEETGGEGTDYADPDYYSVVIDDSEPIWLDVSNSDIVLPVSLINGEIRSLDTNTSFYQQLPFEYEGSTYILNFRDEEEETILWIGNAENDVVVEYDLSFLRNLDEDFNESDNIADPNELMFSEEFEEMTITLQLLELTIMEDEPIEAEMYIHISFE